MQMFSRTCCVDVQKDMLCSCSVGHVVQLFSWTCCEDGEDMLLLLLLLCCSVGQDVLCRWGGQATLSIRNAHFSCLADTQLC